MSLIKSESISNLAKALALAKPKFDPVLKLSENPGFKRNGQASKYADLATAIEATEGALLANGLVVSQFPVSDGDRVGALTLLIHSSGEYFGEAFTLPLGQQNAQTGVAAVTYARRTGYLAALGIAAEDDDGQTAAGREDRTGSSRAPASFDDMPDFQDARHAAPTPNPAPKSQKPTETPKPTPKTPQQALSASAADAAAISPAGSPARGVSEPSIQQYTDFKGITEALQDKAPEQGDAFEEPEVGTLPTETEMVAYRARFTELANQLSTHGKLTASKGLKLNTKLLVFFLSITKAPAAKEVTVQGWDNFFERVDAAIKNPEVGLVGLTKLINKANGIEPKQ